tara:strand:+ start:117 stop:503 length:387 start_codon:yes stop_codon:yes gene_type:complete
MKKRYIVLAGFLALGFIGSLTEAPEAKTTKAAVPAKSIKPAAEMTVQDVVNSHELSMRWGCEKAIKQQLNDPGSYRANAVRYWPSTKEGAKVMVKVDFRARNGFGGYVRNVAACHADTSGNIITAEWL